MMHENTIKNNCICIENFTNERSEAEPPSHPLPPRRKKKKGGINIDSN